MSTTSGMGILRSIESRIEDAFEGTFGRAFRASVEPVELARKLAKELEDGKVVSVRQVYAPNEFTVYLNAKDRARFTDYEASLRTELGLYLAEHARREGYVMSTRPRVLFETEPRLSVGTFGISTRLVPPDGADRAFDPEPEPEVEALLVDEPVSVEAEPEPIPEPQVLPEPEVLPEPAPAAAAPVIPVAEPELPLPEPELPVVQPEVSLPEPAADAAPVDAPTVHFTPDEVAQAAAAALHVDGRSVPLARGTTVLGRSSACDVVLDDANASRRHAEVRLQGGSAVVVDLDSTNGTAVNGKRVREQPLADGDRITIGTTTVVFERRRP